MDAVAKLVLQARLAWIGASTVLHAPTQLAVKSAVAVLQQNVSSATFYHLDEESEAEVNQNRLENETRKQSQE